MNKLRKRGKVGSNSDTGASQSFMSRPGAAGAEAEDLAAAVDRRVAEAERQEATPLKTSGVGGTWTPSETEEGVDKHKPIGAGTWGVFERPANISEAYGGGRQLVLDEDRVARLAAEADAKLAEYRAALKSDVQLQEEHEAEIKAARQESQ